MRSSRSISSDDQTLRNPLMEGLRKSELQSIKQVKEDSPLSFGTYSFVYSMFVHTFPGEFFLLDMPL